MSATTITHSPLYSLWLKADTIALDMRILEGRLAERSEKELGQVRELRELTVQLAEGGRQLADLVRHLAAKVIAMSDDEPNEASTFGGVSADEINETLKPPKPLRAAQDVIYDILEARGWCRADAFTKPTAESLAGAAGFEPATPGLEGRCSSPAELRPRAQADSSIADSAQFTTETCPRCHCRLLTTGACSYLGCNYVKPKTVFRFPSGSEAS